MPRLPLIVCQLSLGCSLLYIERRIHRYGISRGRLTVIGDVIIRVEDYEDLDGRDDAHKLVKEGMVEAWQRRLDLPQKERHTFAFLPNVSSKLRARWFVAKRETLIIESIIDVCQSVTWKMRLRVRSSTGIFLGLGLGGMVKQNLIRHFLPKKCLINRKYNRSLLSL